MKRHTIEIKEGKGRSDGDFLIVVDGGVNMSFDGSIFRISQMKAVAEKTGKILFGKGKFIVENKTEFGHGKCANCGSVNVELQCWENLQTGWLGERGNGETEDTWCNDCEQHAGIEYEND